VQIFNATVRSPVNVSVVTTVRLAVARYTHQSLDSPFKSVFVVPSAPLRADVDDAIQSTAGPLMTPRSAATAEAIVWLRPGVQDEPNLTKVDERLLDLCCLSLQRACQQCDGPPDGHPKPE